MYSKASDSSSSSTEIKSIVHNAAHQHGSKTVHVLEYIHGKYLLSKKFMTTETTIT